MLVTLCACGDNLDPESRGPHRTYVMSRQLIPTSNAAARENGLDLGGPAGGSPDGVIDNQMGMVLSTLSSMGTEVQPATYVIHHASDLVQRIWLQRLDVGFHQPCQSTIAPGEERFVFHQLRERSQAFIFLE